MNKRKGVLETVRKSNRKADRNSYEYKCMQIVVAVLERYFEIYDIDNGTVHSRVFNLLYLSDKYYTYSQFCERASIGKNTLIRYIAKYEELASKVIQQLNL